ncbi:PstS family phosphate ABC transporter substrate-binding protein [Synechococcus elongatus]|uniref:Phosphate-binding protein n=1 Tax=Synechococcus elongatus PCC 11801 TaxID=2219813 RepID=A0AAN1QM64_SYNEL|nr:PstS family phosphate ABC transporter substrate-binding protein [Synechococcus elongatus]AZB71895.1 protein sphX [Synechococcus elongatus PCC 11801]
MTTLKPELRRAATLLPIVAVAASSFLPMQEASAQRALVTADGSSTVFPISEAVAEEFQKRNKNINVTVGVSGTGGGFKRFCNGEIDIANASRPIKKEEIEACRKKGIRYIELPVAFDALTVVVNKSNPVNSITTAELAKIFGRDAEKKVTNWRQVKSSFPNLPLRVYAPGTDSGTYDYFNEAILNKKGTRGDLTASEDDNILVQGVSRDRGGIGFFGFSYYEENKNRLKALAVVNSNGKAVMPSVQNVINGTYDPLARPVFIYVSEQAAKKANVRSFVNFYLQNAGKLSREVGFVPLPARAYTAATQRFRSNKTGTVFAGKSLVGATIEELLKAEGIN